MQRERNLQAFQKGSVTSLLYVFNKTFCSMKIIIDQTIPFNALIELIIH